MIWWAQIGRLARAVILAPLLLFCLWLEVIAGTGNAWDALQGKPSQIGFVAWMLYAAIGPVTLLIATIRTRSRIQPMLTRTLQIEKTALMVAAPLGILGLLVISAESVI